MKAMLKKIPYRIYYVENGVEIEGKPIGITGNLSYITGDLSGIRGDLSGIRGNLSGITGNLSDCEITEEERKNGIDISVLIGE